MAYVEPIIRTRRHHGVDEPILCPAAIGAGWVYATIALRVYRHRLGFAEYDLAMAAENKVLVVRTGWRFVGRRRLPMITIVEEGWMPRSTEL